MAPEWMNWDGWRWVGTIITYGLGFWLGWSWRGVVEAHKPALAREAMGIDWMSMEEISEAIPPRFTQWVGRRLYDHLYARPRVAA